MMSVEHNVFWPNVCHKSNIVILGTLSLFLQRDRRYIVFCCHANVAAVVGDSNGSCLDFNN